MKRRMIGIDILRIFMAVLILLRHTVTLGACTLKHQEFILSQTGIVMSLFFMMSGYCLFSSYRGMESIQDIILFYKKRFLRLMPTYWMVETYLLILALVTQENAAWRLEIFPVRILGMQIHYNIDVFAGVSWFISCLLVCYILYPLIIIGIKSGHKPVRILLMASIIFLLFYTVLLNLWADDIPTYYSPYFRFLEFSYGIFLGFAGDRIDRANWVPNTLISLLILAGAIVVIELLIGIPSFQLIVYVFLALIILSAGRISVSENLKVAKTIVFLSSLSFDVFILQDVLFSKPIYEAMGRYNGMKKLGSVKYFSHI